MVLDYGWHDLVGNLGVACILITQFMLHLGRLSTDGLTYSAWNVAGALLIGISLLVDFNLSSFIIEVFWFVINLYGMVRIALQRHQLAAGFADSDR